MVEEKQENPLHAKEEGHAEGSSEETTGNGRSLGVFSFEGDIPLTQAVPLGLQHVLAMFVGNLTPLLIVTGVCGLATAEFAEIQLALLQNAMLIAGVVTLVQLFGIGPVGGEYLLLWARRPASSACSIPLPHLWAVVLLHMALLWVLRSSVVCSKLFWASF